MSYGYGRSSGGYLRPDDSGGGGRWDRDRFERVRAKSRGAEVRDSYRFVEDDRYDRRGERIDIEVDDRYERSGPRVRYDERDRYTYDYDTYTPPRRQRPDFLDEDRIEIRERRLAPYEAPRSRNYDLPYRPQKPAYIRRQSSLDTMDRRPLPRYGDRDLDVTVEVRPPRDSYDDYRYRNDSPMIEEDYRDVRIRRERERSTYRTNSDRTRDPAFEDNDYSPPREQRKIKRGKTRVPKRLVHRRAIAELGFPFDEDEYFFTIQVALTPGEIDAMIHTSDIFRERDLIPVEPPKLLEAPAPSSSPPPPEEVEVVETHTTRIIENPTDEDIERLRSARKDRSEEASVHESISAHESVDRHGSVHEDVHESVHESVHDDSGDSSHSDEVEIRTRRASNHHSRHGRGRSRIVADEILFEAGRDASGERPVAVTALVEAPSRRRREERDIKAEIKALELEKKALKLEREAQDRRDRGLREARDREYEAERLRRTSIEVEKEDKEVLRIEKDRRGRMSIVRSTH